MKEERRCYECGEVGHLAANYPNKKEKNKDEKSKSKKDKEGKTMTFRRRRSTRRRTMLIVLSGIPMPQVKVMMNTTTPIPNHLWALPITRSPLSSTMLLHHVSWPRAVRYDMIRAIVRVMRIKEPSKVSPAWITIRAPKSLSPLAAHLITIGIGITLKLNPRTLTHPTQPLHPTQSTSTH